MSDHDDAAPIGAPHGTDATPDPGAPGVAVVTGGASGIGLALVKGFLARGWSVAIGDVDGDAISAVVGDRILGHVLDVSDPEQMAAFAEAVRDRLGTPTIVCNNAGVNAYGYNTWDAPPSTWEWIWRVNVMGVVNGIRAFAPQLIEADRGRIINTASVAGLASAPGIAPYAASKHAIVAISESLRDELHQAGSSVGVSVLCPSLVATDIGSSARHWPEMLGRVEAVGPAAAEFMGRLEDARSRAPGPERMADATFDAIARDRFLVLLDDHELDEIRDRRLSILDMDTAPGESGGEPGEWF